MNFTTLIPEAPSALRLGNGTIAAPLFASVTDRASRQPKPHQPQQTAWAVRTPATLNTARLCATRALRRQRRLHQPLGQVAVLAHQAGIAEHHLGNTAAISSKKRWLRLWLRGTLSTSACLT